MVSALAAGHGHVSGLLGPARVVGLDGATLKLGYDASHENIRQRASRQDKQVAAALGELFGRPLRCEYVPTGEAGAPLPADNGAVPVLSSAERAEVAADPAVKAVLDFFDGSLTHIRREVAAGGGEDDGGGA